MRESQTMSNLHLVALYAGINIALLLVLALLVVGGRQRTKVSLGHGEDEGLLRVTRVHGNAAEYIPAGLVGLAILATFNPEVPPWAIHVGGASLTLGRVLHAIGLYGKSGLSLGRSVGTLLTWFAFAAIAGLLLAVGSGVQL
jgi:uncharacterized protein